MKNKHYVLLIILAALLLTSCIQNRVDWNTHKMKVSVYNWTDDVVSLKVTCSDRQRTTEGAHIDVIPKRTDEEAEPPACTVTWIPGKYHQDIDGFITKIKFNTEFRKNNTPIDFENYADVPSVSFEMDKDHELRLGLVSTFLPQRMTFEQYSDMREALETAFGSGEDSPSYALASLYSHYSSEADATIENWSWRDITDEKHFFDKAGECIKELHAGAGLPASVRDVIDVSAQKTYCIVSLSPNR